MRLFHTTYHAEAIQREGFRDSEGFYMTSAMASGVWLADRPLDVNSGADGDQVLALEIPEADVSEFEWIEEGKPYREFLVPAAIANRYQITERRPLYDY